MDAEYRVQISLPLDVDGFLRRECPTCSRQFKWHHGPANEEAERHGDPPAYSCPLCGQPAAGDSWNTRDQIEYAQQAAMPAAMNLIGDELEAAFRGAKGVRFKRGNTVASETPEPLVEPDDMTIVKSPCHDYEPVKVPEDHVGALYCLVCGAPYVT